MYFRPTGAVALTPPPRVAWRASTVTPSPSPTALHASPSVMPDQRWAAAPATTGSPKLGIELTVVAQHLEGPVHVTNAGDSTDRLFVVEKPGRIRVVAGGRLLPTPFLDIVTSVAPTGWAEGLFSVAFSPHYRTNGFFYVYYTDRTGKAVIARYSVSSDPQRADTTAATTVLTLDARDETHNGGQLAFGPDGYLYIGTGDGSTGGTHTGSAQNLRSLHGKLLRLDVEGTQPYAVPPDNPFMGRPDARPEVWAFGLRNPWRFAFDRLTGDLYIGDVGQHEREEIDLLPARSQGGQNFGWHVLEGRRCVDSSGSCAGQALVPPVTEYGHDLGCAVTGGYRYRGRQSPALRDMYLFADYCSGRIWALTPDDGWRRTELARTERQIGSFGEDEQGELYIADTGAGEILKLSAHSQ